MVDMKHFKYLSGRLLTEAENLEMAMDCCVALHNLSLISDVSEISDRANRTAVDFRDMTGPMELTMQYGKAVSIDKTPLWFRQLKEFLSSCVWLNADQKAIMDVVIRDSDDAIATRSKRVRLEERPVVMRRGEKLTR